MTLVRNSPWPIIPRSPLPFACPLSILRFFGPKSKLTLAMRQTIRYSQNSAMFQASLSTVLRLYVKCVHNKQRFTVLSFYSRLCCFNPYIMDFDKVDCFLNECRLDHLLPHFHQEGINDQVFFKMTVQHIAELVPKLNERIIFESKYTQFAMTNVIFRLSQFCHHLVMLF